MPESLCFRTPLGNQRVHGSKTLTKSATEYFYPNFPLIQEILSWKNSLLVRSEILIFFVNTLTANNMSSPNNSEKLPQQVQTQIS